MISAFLMVFYIYLLSKTGQTGGFIMKVYVNNTEITIFNGAKVEDVLRKYSMDEYKQVKSGNMNVYDKYENRVMLGGELREGAKLYIKAD